MNTPTETKSPRTDAAIQNWHGEVAFIHPDFARQLEQELQQAREELALLKKQLTDNYNSQF